jgi:hypothetical protein
MSNPETRLTNKIKKALWRYDPTSVWYKIHGGPSQQKGIADLLGCYRGRFVALEVKRDRRFRASPAQRYQLDRVNDAKGFSAVVYSPEDALGVLREIDRLLDSLSNEPASNKDPDSTDG